MLVTTIGAGVAMAAVLVWAYGAILRRVLRGDRIPAILVLATLGLTIRTLVGLISGSTFAYFVQPIATTVALATVFLGSALIGRPVIARLAHDFCPISAEVADRPAIVRLFGGLTMLWAGVHVLTAVTTFTMLVTMPVATFVAVKTVACFGISAAAVAITIAWALRTVHSEQLGVRRDLIAPDGCGMHPLPSRPPHRTVAWLQPRRNWRGCAAEVACTSPTAT